MIFYSILMLAIVVIAPVGMLLWGRFRATPAEREEANRITPPWATALVGGIIAVPAAVAAALMAWGFLLPGLGWIERNAISDWRIWIAGRSSRGPNRGPPTGAWLRPEDFDLNLLLTGIPLGLLVLGLFLVISAWRDARRRRGGAQG